MKSTSSSQSTKARRLHEKLARDIFPSLSNREPDRGSSKKQSSPFNLPPLAKKRKKPRTVRQSDHANGAAAVGQRQLGHAARPGQEVARRSGDSDVLEAIARTTEKLTEVVGVPGAKKTGLLIQRIEHLVQQGVAPKAILVLSFANSTVAPMQQRIGPRFDGVSVKTCHALALDLIRKNLGLLALEEMPTVMSEPAELALIGKAIAKVHKKMVQDQAGEVDGAEEGADAQAAWFDEMQRPAGLRQLQRLFNFKSVASEKLAKLVVRQIFSDVLRSANLGRLRQIFRAYRKLRRLGNSITYGDMIDLATKVVADPRSHIGPYVHVLVDEFQDCGPQQVKLIRQLGQRVRSLIAVGDPNQNLYGWMGSEYVGLAADGSAVSRASLDFSFRLTAQNAALAVSVLDDARLSIRTRRSGPKPILHVHRSLAAESRAVTQQVRDLLVQGVNPEHIAVLARTREVRASVDAALRAAGVGTRLLGDEMGLHLALGVAWLVHLVEQRDAGREISADVLHQRLRLRAPNADWSRAASELRKVSSLSLEGRYKQCASIYLRMLGGVRSHPQERNEINRWAPTCRSLTSASQLRALIEGGEGGLVTLSTIHGAKGREWEHVILLDATEGVLPHERSVDDAQLAEERRLMYVAVTRARTAFHAHHAQQSHRGAATDARLSRFLISAVADDVIDVRGPAKGQVTQLALW